MKIGVVIPAFKSPGDLKTCLESVFSSVLHDGWSFQVVVVNNSPEQGPVDEIIAGYDLTVISPHKNLGIAGGRNAGASHLEDCDIVVFVDQDIQLETYCLSSLVDALLTEPKAGVATPVIFYRDSPTEVWAAGTLVNARTGRVRFIDQPSAEPFEVDVAPSVIAATQQTLQQTSGFDRRFFAVWEDTDFCFRVRQAGAKVICVPSARATHNTPITRRDQMRHLASRSYWVGRNRVLFVRRHGSSFGTFIAFLPLYVLYYFGVAVQARKPLQFFRFLAGTIIGFLVPVGGRSKERRPYAATVALTTILVIVWFVPGMVLGGGEQGAPYLRPDVAADWSWWSWSDSRTGGVFPTLPAGSPFWGSLFGLSRIGATPWLLQAIVFWICMVVAGCSVAFLAKRHAPSNGWGPTAAAAIYLLAPFAAINVWHRFLLTHLLLLAYLPLALALMRQFYLQGRLRPFLIFLAVTPWFAAAFSTPGFVAVVAFALIADAVILAIAFREPKVYRRLIVVLAAWAGVNLFWLIPFFSFSGATLGSEISAVDAAASYRGVSQYLDLSNVFRGLNGFITDRTRSIQEPFVWSWFLTALFILPFAGFAAALISRRKDIALLAGVAVIGLFLMKGASPPGGDISARAMERHQALGVFRNPYERLGFLYHLPLSLLIGVSVGNLSRAKRWLPLIAVPVVALAGWPVINGSIFSTPAFGSYRLELPREYESIESWVDENIPDSSRIIMSPVTSEGITYRWVHGYRGVDLAPALARSSLSMTSGTQLPDVLLRELRQFPTTNDSDSIARLLGARAVIVRNDVDPTLDRLLDPAVVRRILETNRAFRFRGSRGNLDLFEVAGCAYPRLYATRAVTAAPDPSLNDLVAAAQRCRTIVSDSMRSSGSSLTSESAEPQAIPFARVSPVHYEVALPEGFRGWLILSEAWHPDWRALRTTGTCPRQLVTCLLARSTRASAHPAPVVANGYANAWYIDGWPGGRFSLVFSAQQKVEVGAAASLAVFLLVLILAFIRSRIAARRAIQPVGGNG